MRGLPREEIVLSAEAEKEPTPEPSRRRTLLPHPSAAASSRARQAARDSRVRWWERNAGLVYAVVLPILTFGLIVLALQLFSRA
jgi:hypothetical protein